MREIVKAARYIAIVVIFLISSVLYVAANQEKPVLGVYLWGGLLNGERSVYSLNKSVTFLLDKGFQAIRITLTPKDIAMYGISGCNGPDGMACSLKTALSGPAFNDSRLKILILTLHGFGIERRAMVDKEYLNENKKIIRDKYFESMDFINSRFSGTNTKIVISNWEGDNFVFCGAVFRFAQNKNFADRCGGTNNENINKRMEGFINWLNFRDDIVNDFRSQSGSDRISHSAEINNIFIFKTSCKHSCPASDTVFERIRNSSQKLGCSYSAYDSLPFGRMSAALKEISTGCNNIIIGEAGIAINDIVNSKTKADRIISQLEKLKSNEVKAVIIWNAFESKADRDVGFSLFTERGADMTFAYWQNLMKSYNSDSHIR